MHVRFMRSRLIIASILACSLLNSLPACYSARVPQRYSHAKLQAALAEFEQEGLVIGEFPLSEVIDGDTITVAGLQNSLRLLALDTEETFKKEHEWRAYEQGWDVYLQSEEKKSRTPVKIPTPLGEEAKKFAKEFFKGVKRVRLERDHSKEIRDRYNRYLAYVFVEKDGKELNFNVECVRAGMSPYFSKYSYSRRFHQQFVDAQNEARAARRGIWDPSKQHYRDYEERIAWWNRRADFIKKFEEEAEENDNYIALTQWDALQKLEQMVDREVVILATVGDIKINEKGPIKVMLSRRMFSDFPLIFFDRDVFVSSQVADSKGDYIRVRGVVSKYKNKYNNQETLQIQVRLPGQIIRDSEQGPPKKTVTYDQNFINQENIYKNQIVINHIYDQGIAYDPSQLSS